MKEEVSKGDRKYHRHAIVGWVSKTPVDARAAYKIHDQSESDERQRTRIDRILEHAESNSACRVSNRYS